MDTKRFSQKRMVTIVMIGMAFFITAVVGFISVLAETGRPDDAVAAQKALAAKDSKPVSPLNEADVVSEETSKRQKFVKQFHLSDGTFLAATYSVPVHYKKKSSSAKTGTWKEIDTTLKKTPDRKYYKTKSTSLQIRAAAKADSKSLISLKRGGDSLAWKPVTFVCFPD